MSWLHDALARLFGLLLDPLERLQPLWGLTLVSAASGILMLFAFKWTSHPAAIRRAKQRSQAHLLAVRLYREDLGVVFRSQARFLAALGGYLGQMLLPFAALLVPFALLFGQLDARYATRALHPGERAVFKVVAAPDGLDRWRLETADGVDVETKPVRIAARGEIVWRIRARALGESALLVTDGERGVQKRVRVDAGDVGAAPARAAASLSSFFLAPAEAALDPSSGIRAVTVSYPELDLTVAGRRVHWIVVFLVVSAVVAFALRKRAGVEF